MNELILEIGMKLEKNISYYHDMLTKNKMKLVFSCVTHDIYYTNKDLNSLSENEMKSNCIRIRNCNILNQNSDKENENIKKEKELLENGYRKVFDTVKFDFHYCNDCMKGRIQLQEIKDIGLVVYYDNPDYYTYPLDEQRKKLIDELNSYGFSFEYTDLGIDKLRTLYYKKDMYSSNQNA